HPEKDTVRDYPDLAADVDLGVLSDDGKLVAQLRMKRLKRVEQSVARRPRGLADDDLPVPVAQLEFVDRGYGALPRPDVADDHEVVREVYRVEDREDRKGLFRCPADHFSGLPLSFFLR